jgi:hypothetical protein
MQDLAIAPECRCDCCNCVTGQHYLCYYNPPLYPDVGVHTCPIKFAWDKAAFEDF